MRGMLQPDGESRRWLGKALPMENPAGMKAATYNFSLCL